jgi:hypothetical protein
MIVRRGLIRLWIVSTTLWVVAVEGVAVQQDWPWWVTDQVVLEPPDPTFHDQPGLGVPVKGNPFSNDPHATDPDWDALPVCPHWISGEKQGEGICRESRRQIAVYWLASAGSAMWRNADLALGVPFAVLVLGCAAWWVAMGFRSGPGRGS